MKKIISFALGLFSVSSSSFANCYEVLEQNAIDCSKVASRESAADCSNEQAEIDAYWEKFNSASPEEKEVIFKDAMQVIKRVEKMGLIIRSTSSCAVCTVEK